MPGNPVTQDEFKLFRVEMRDYMKQQTRLMGQMVELQTKHTNLESQFTKLEKDIDDLEERVRPIEQSLGGQSEKTRYNQSLIWLLLGLVMGVAGNLIQKALS